MEKRDQLLHLCCFCLWFCSKQQEGIPFGEMGILQQALCVCSSPLELKRFLNRKTTRGGEKSQNKWKKEENLVQSSTAVHISMPL